MNEITEKHKALLDKLYYNSDGATGSFSAATPLYQVAKKLDSTLNLKIVKKYLQGNLSYLLHKRAIRKFPRKSLLVIAPNNTWSCDLIFYTSDKKSNNNKVFCLNVIDNFSHKAYSRALKNKTAEETLSQFKDIIREAAVYPKRLFLDKGKSARLMI